MSEPTATPLERDVVTVRGDDAGEYLQTQLSQDVMAIARGESGWSFLLTPKSEIVALMRITRSGVDEFILDMEPGWGDTVRQTIDEFLFRMDVKFDQAVWPGVAWRGDSPKAAEAPILAPTPWSGVLGMDVVGPGVQVPESAEVLSAFDLEQIRIGSGWPSMATDIGPAVTPAMTGLVAQTVGFDKGCYTGQEFVARVHYRGTEPPRRLIRLTFDEGAVLAADATIVVEGDEVGHVTSVARETAMGYLKRGYETPSTGSVGNVEVRLLPTEQQ
jgi:folate-binding protein YgfZ